MKVQGSTKKLQKGLEEKNNSKDQPNELS